MPQIIVVLHTGVSPDVEALVVLTGATRKMVVIQATWGRGAASSCDCVTYYVMLWPASL